MDQIQFLEGQGELLDIVEPMWEKLNHYHMSNSKNFSNHFTKLTFDARRKKFQQEEGLLIRIDLVKDRDMNTYIGYCITTVNPEGVGELDSLFVEEAYRKFGIGAILMDKAIFWLNENKAKKKIIGVAVGNENVLNFYEKYNFYPRMIILEEIPQ